MTSQYLMHCVLRKTLCTTSSVSERGDRDSENHSGDPEHRITLCEINSIKTDNIDGYIIKPEIFLVLGIRVSYNESGVPL